MRKKGHLNTSVHRATELAFFGLKLGVADEDIKHVYRRMKYALPHDADSEEVEQLTAAYRYLRKKKNRSDPVY